MRDPRNFRSAFIFEFSPFAFFLKLPVVYHEELTDKEKVFQKERRYIKAKESEKLGLKHFLGHTKNLPYADCGLAISKSSYSLNKLQDVMSFWGFWESELDFIENCRD